MGLDVVVEDQVQTRLEDADIVLEQQVLAFCTLLHYQSRRWRLQEKRFPKLSKSSWHLILWPILLTPLFFSSSSQTRVIGCTALMAIWWATEVATPPFLQIVHLI